MRDIKVLRSAVTSSKHLALVPEVQSALLKWIKANSGGSGVLIGGLALSFYCKPRYTEDVDILYLRTDLVPDAVQGFRRHRKAAFEDLETNVEIETVVPESFSNLPTSVAQQVIKTSVVHDGIKVASLEGMLVLKLIGGRMRDEADVVDMIKVVLHRSEEAPDLAHWKLTDHQRDLYAKLAQRAAQE